jgi:hypothetical protein
MFIDDNANTVKIIYENCKVENVCIVEKAHNKNIELDENIIRVDSLFESIRYLKEVI